MAENAAMASARQLLQAFDAMLQPGRFQDRGLRVEGNHPA